MLSPPSRCMLKDSPNKLKVASGTTQSLSEPSTPPSNAAAVLSSATKTVKKTISGQNSSSQQLPSTNQQSSYLQDPGLSCLLSQLGRINAQIQHLDYLQKCITNEEEAYKRELAATLAKTLVSSSTNNGQESDRSQSNLNHGTGTWSPSQSTTHPNDDSKRQFDQWVKCWDDEVGAEYYYNAGTGEASWVDPRHGNIAA